MATGEEFLEKYDETIRGGMRHLRVLDWLDFSCNNYSRFVNAYQDLMQDLHSIQFEMRGQNIPTDNLYTRARLRTRGELMDLVAGRDARMLSSTRW